MVWWKAVSKMATCGIPGNSACAPRIPARFALLCSGASIAISWMAWVTSSSMSTERVNFSPPCATRCPTALMEATWSTTPILGSVSVARMSRSAS